MGHGDRCHLDANHSEGDAVANTGIQSLVLAEGLHATPITADIVRLVGRWGIQTEGTRVDNIDLKPLRPTEILA